MNILKYVIISLFGRTRTMTIMPEFLDLDIISVNEASFARIVKQMQTKDFALLTGFLKGKTSKENRKRNKDLIAKFLRPLKIGPVMVKGFFKGEKQPDGTIADVKEDSLFFSKPDDMSLDEFEKLIVKILKAFGQTSALVGLKEGAFFLKQNGNKDFFAKKFNLNPKDLEKGFSKFKGKTFTFEGMYQPSGWIQALMLDSYGLKYSV